MAGRHRFAHARDMGHDAVGERHAAGDKYLIGQVGLEARVISDDARMVSVIMLGQMKMTPAR